MRKIYEANIGSLTITLLGAALVNREGKVVRSLIVFRKDLSNPAASKEFWTSADPEVGLSQFHSILATARRMQADKRSMKVLTLGQTVEDVTYQLACSLEGNEMHKRSILGRARVA